MKERISAPLSEISGQSGEANVQDDVSRGQENRLNRIGSASIPRLITEFAIPSIIGMVVSGTYSIIDSIFLGHALGKIGLSAATAATPTTIVLLAIALFIGNGGNALAALRLGAKDHEGAERSLGNVVTLSLLVSIAIALFVLFPPTIDALLILSGTTEEVWDYTKIFVQILSVGFVLQAVAMGVNNFIRTVGAPNRALLTMVIGTIVCVICNYFFVIVWGWGMVGSAVATLLGQGASVVSVLWFFLFTKNVPLRLKAEMLKLEWRTVRMIVSLGFASFVLQIGAAIVNFALNNLIVMYGAQSAIGTEGALAAIGVVQRVLMFSVFPLIGLSIAVQPILGFNFGARLFGRVRTCLIDACVAATVISTLMWIVVYLFPTHIVTIFGVSDPMLASFTARALLIQLAMLPFVGFQIIGSNYFQATGQPMKSVFLTLTRQVLFLLPLFILFPLLLPQVCDGITSLEAIYYAVPTSDFLSIFTVAIFIAWEAKRINSLAAHERR